MSCIVVQRTLQLKVRPIPARECLVVNAEIDRFIQHAMNGISVDTL